ncbi:MAG: PAS domain-containing protein [Comamonadaceae bacterium]|nr:PAS domain-containing protein [Comamonadaceae bacterium]
MLVLDASLHVVRANQAFYDCFATTPRETLQVSLYALGSAQWDIPQLRRLLEDLLPHRGAVRDHEVAVVCPGIGRRTMLLNAARVSYPDATTMLLTIEDVTERHATLQALSEAARQKDDFLAVLAHELRNPLAGMSNALHLWQHLQADAAQKSSAVRDARAPAAQLRCGWSTTCSTSRASPAVCVEPGAPAWTSPRSSGWPART